MREISNGVIILAIAIMFNGCVISSAIMNAG